MPLYLRLRLHAKSMIITREVRDWLRDDGRSNVVATILYACHAVVECPAIFSCTMRAPGRWPFYGISCLSFLAEYA